MPETRTGDIDSLHACDNHVSDVMLHGMDEHVVSFRT